MPCDIGYKSFSRVVVPAPQPLAFRQRTEAPKVDAELMARIGQDDPDFVEWLNGLDTEPLLKKALERALAAAGPTGGLRYFIDNGGLAADGKYTSGAQKRRLEEIADRVGRRFQMEALAIVAQLLDFETQIAATTENGREVLMLEGEKHGNSPVHEYLRVTLDPAKGSSMLFEHFASKQERDLVRAKFAALAQKLGVKLDIGETTESGSPVPAGAVHKHFIKGGKR